MKYQIVCVRGKKPFEAVDDAAAWRIYDELWSDLARHEGPGGAPLRMERVLSKPDKSGVYDVEVMTRPHAQ